LLVFILNQQLNVVVSLSLLQGLKKQIMSNGMRSDLISIVDAGFKAQKACNNQQKGKECFVSFVDDG